MYGVASGGPFELFRGLYQSLVLGELAGLWDTSPGGPLGYSASSPFDLPFDDAIAWFRSRDVVTPDEFALLSESAAERAFRIAGVTDRRVLDAVHGSLDRAIASGGTLSEWVEELDEKLDVLGVEPFGLHQLDVIFQNAVGDAYAGGRYTQMKRTADARPFWRYSTAEDDKVRPAHEAMHGTVARHDDPLWEVWYPPNGHRCRCEVESLTAEEIGPDALKPPPSVEPDRGWARSPARRGAADLASRAHRQEARQLDLPLSGLASPTTRVGRLRRRDLDAAHDRAMAGLDRQGDAVRRRVIRQALGLSDDRILALFEGADELRFHRGGLALPTGGQVVELAIPAQDRLALEEVVRRLAFAGLEVKTTSSSRIRLRRATGGLAQHEVPDPNLHRGGSSSPRWSSEVVLRIEGETERVVQLLLEQAQRSGGGPAVPFAPELVDLVVLGEGPLPPGLRAVTHAITAVEEVGTASVPTTHILPGWEPITVGVPLREP